MPKFSIGLKFRIHRQVSHAVTGLDPAWMAAANYHPALPVVHRDRVSQWFFRKNHLPARLATLYHVSQFGEGLEQAGFRDMNIECAIGDLHHAGLLWGSNVLRKFHHLCGL